MAVTKIRKISSWTLLVCAIISVVVFLMFYVGGIVDPSAEMKEPVYTGLLLNWMYVIFGLTAISTIIFAIWQFVTSLKTNPKSALTGLGVIVLFVVMMFICYSIGNGTPLPIVSADTAKYNVESWLKITDMWIYSVYILVGLIVIAILWGSIKKALGK